MSPTVSMSSDFYTEIFQLSGEHPSFFWLGLFGLIALAAWGSGQVVSRLVNLVLRRLTTRHTDEFYSLVMQPQQNLLKTVLIVGLLDIVAYLVVEQDLKVRWYPYPT
jgi:multisubunit Na+/H+ antiporter MnhE subunit